MTRNDSCAEEGDYLRWADMEWILHGEARKERTEKDEMCEEKADKRSDHAIVQVELSECSEWTPISLTRCSHKAWQ